MTFLAPALLALGLAVSVPLLLHLLQRQPGPRVVFPALRYLRRAEREHARRIRLRQILLLALRVLAILLLAAAAARPFLPGAGSGHPPTAVALVLDNSLSTGAVVGDRRVLDELKAAALATLAAAGPGDRFWLIRAGSPWEPAITGDATAVAEAVRRTEPTAAGADLVAAVQRARSLLALEGEGPREIQLLSDLQTSAFEAHVESDGTGDAAGAATLGEPVVVGYVPGAAAPKNRAVTGLEIGGGLPPRAEERSTVAAGVMGEEDGDSVAVRLVVDGSVRAAGVARPGATVLLAFPARSAGLVTGYVELDPDALRADDRRYFVAEVAPPLPVAVPPGQPFLEEAIAVLEEGGRVRRVGADAAEVVLAPGARWAERVREGRSVLVLPPSSPLERAAANQRLAAAGIPWRYEAPGGGEVRVDTTGSGPGRYLGGVRLREAYGLSGPRTDSVAIRLQTGEPWAVLGRAVDGGRFVLLGSPLTTEGGTLPVSAAMVPFLDHVLSAWTAGAEPRPELEPGAQVSVAGDAVVGPDGRTEVEPGALYRVSAPGIYFILSGADTVTAHAVNAPPSESRLARIPPGALAERLPGLRSRTAGAEEWGDAIFRERTGREVTRWLVGALLALLAVEMAAAASGRSRARRGAGGPPMAGASPGRMQPSTAGGGTRD